MAMQHTDVHQVLACVARHSVPQRSQWRLVSKAWRLAYDSNCTRLRVDFKHDDDLEQVAKDMHRLLAGTRQMRDVGLKRAGELDEGDTFDGSPLLLRLSSIPADSLPHLEAITLDGLTTCQLPEQLPRNSCFSRLQLLTLECEKHVRNLHQLSLCTRLSTFHILIDNSDVYPEIDSAGLARALPSLSSLTNLAVYAHALHTDLLAALSHLSALVELQLGFTTTCDVNTLASSLGRLSRLTSLRLQSANATCPGESSWMHPRAHEPLDCLAVPLEGTLTGLQSLSLNCLHLPASVLSAIPASNLTELDLNDSALNPQSQAALITALQGRLRGAPELHKLALGDLPNQLTPETAALLGRACGQLPHLQHVALWTEPAEVNEQAAAVHAGLVTGLASAPLTQLRLGSSRMGSEGMMALAQAVRREGCTWKSTLEVLFIDEAINLAEGPAAAFIVSLNHLLFAFTLDSTQAKLRELDLSGNLLGLLGTVTIAPQLARLSALTRLGMAANGMGPPSGNVMEVMLLLRAMPNLDTLLVGDNDGWVPPLDVLLCLPCLKRLDLDPRDDEELEHIRTSLTRAVVTADHISNLDILDTEG